MPLVLGLEDKVPDTKTVWLYREQLVQAGAIGALFEDFDGYLEQQGYLAVGGQIIGASIVSVPKQRNSRGDNARIKDGDTPGGWARRRWRGGSARSGPAAGQTVPDLRSPGGRGLLAIGCAASVMP